MTPSDRRRDRHLRAWLHDGPGALPDRQAVLRQTLERVALTP